MFVVLMKKNYRHEIGANQTTFAGKKRATKPWQANAMQLIYKDNTERRMDKQLSAGSNWTVLAMRCGLPQRHPFTP